MKLNGGVRSALYACVLVMMLWGCGAKMDDDKTFVSDFVVAYQALKSEKDVLAMDRVAKFDWDQLFVVTPYTPLEHVTELLGKPVPDVVKATRIDERDDINVLLFVKGGAVVAVIKLPRQDVDFSLPQSAGPLARHAAVFTKAGAGKALMLAGSGKP